MILSLLWKLKASKNCSIRKSEGTQFYLCIGWKSFSKFQINRTARIFFENKVNILDCLFQLPRRYQFHGHPFYYSALKELEKMSDFICKEVENILSIPLWFNRFLKTKFDADISKAGYNFIKDIFPEQVECQTLVGLSG